MVDTGKARLRNLLAFLLTGILAVWVGGSIVVDALVVPSAFRHLPRKYAVEIGQVLFHRFNYVECLLGIAAVLLSFAIARQGWRTVRAHRTATGLVLFMTLVALAFLLLLTPAIASKVETLTDRGIDWGNPRMMPPERAALRTLHTIYGALDLLKIAAGVGVFWLLAKRGPR